MPQHVSAPDLMHLANASALASHTSQVWRRRSARLARSGQQPWRAAVSCSKEPGSRLAELCHSNGCCIASTPSPCHAAHSSLTRMGKAGGVLWRWRSSERHAAPSSQSAMPPLPALAAPLFVDTLPGRAAGSIFGPRCTPSAAAAGGAAVRLPAWSSCRQLSTAFGALPLQHKQCVRPCCPVGCGRGVLGMHEAQAPEGGRQEGNRTGLAPSRLSISDLTAQLVPQRPPDFNVMRPCVLSHYSVQRNSMPELGERRQGAAARHTAGPGANAIGPTAGAPPPNGCWRMSG